MKIDTFYDFLHCHSMLCVTEFLKDAEFDTLNK